MPISVHQKYLNRNKRTLEQRLRYKYSLLASRAIHLFIPFSLTFREFYELWTKQKGKCVYSGKRMSASNIGGGLRAREWSLSVDRLDPSLGYSKSNCVLCRFEMNRRKGRKDFFSPQFLETYPDWVSNVLSIKPELQQLAA